MWVPHPVDYKYTIPLILLPKYICSISPFSSFVGILKKHFFLEDFPFFRGKGEEACLACFLILTNLYWIQDSETFLVFLIALFYIYCCLNIDFNVKRTSTVSVLSYPFITDCYVSIRTVFLYFLNCLINIVGLSGDSFVILFIVQLHCWKSSIRFMYKTLWCALLL